MTRTRRRNVRSLAALTLLVLLSVALPAPSAHAARPPKPTSARTILSEWRRDVWQDPDLRAMDVTGANGATVVVGVKRGGQARWSPDGTRIGGYHRQSADSTTALDRTMMSARADGTDERVVVSGWALDAFNVATGHKSLAGGPDFLPFGAGSWGPGGAALVLSGVVRFEGPTPAADDDLYRNRLFAVSHSNGAVTAVTTGDGPFADLEPHWSAALNKIVFVRAQAGVFGAHELWVVNPDGTGLQQLSDFAAAAPSAGYGTHLAAPAWSPDGTRIVVVGNLDGANQRTTGDLWVLDVALGVDGSVSQTAQRVLRGDPSASEWQPAWSPDGARVAYIRRTPANDRQSRYQLVLASVSSAQDTVIADSTKQAIFFPDWRMASS